MEQNERNAYQFHCLAGNFSQLREDTEYQHIEQAHKNSNQGDLGNPALQSSGSETTSSLYDIRPSRDMAGPRDGISKYCTIPQDTNPGVYEAIPSKSLSDQHKSMTSTTKEVPLHWDEKSMKSTHDHRFLGVYQHDGSLSKFLSSVFGFLYRCTGFYVPNKTGISFPSEIAESTLLNIFNQWKVGEEEIGCNSHNMTVEVNPDLLVESVDRDRTANHEESQENSIQHSDSSKTMSTRKKNKGNRTSQPEDLFEVLNPQSTMLSNLGSEELKLYKELLDKTHITTSTSEAKDKYTCEICEREFGFRSNLQRHILTHSKKKKFTCDDCGKGFHRKCNLELHSRVHTEDRKFKCTMCEKSFCRSSSLSHHVQSHSLVTPYSCSVCGKGFKQKPNMNQHMRLHTEELKLECEICRKRFRHKFNLSEHLARHAQGKRFTCTICGKGVRSKSYLKEHVLLHNNELPFSCEFCGKRFHGKQNLKAHLLIHTQEGKYKCEVCGRGFALKNNLVTHSLIHTEEKMFQCATCGKQFRRRSSMKRHNLIHSPAKPTTCHICGKVFAQQNLYYHLQTHSTVKKYKCEICGKDFRKNTQLKEHLYIHSDVRSFVCQACGKDFKQKTAWKTHMRMQHCQ